MAADTKINGNNKYISDNLIHLMDNELTSLKFYNQPKRVTLPDGSRDWVVRVCWEAYKGNTLYKSEWDGFENTPDAIDDLINFFLDK